MLDISQIDISSFHGRFLLDYRIPQTYTVIIVLSSFFFMLYWVKEGLKNYPFNGKSTLVHLAQPLDRREQAERAAARREEQFAIRRGHRAGAVAVYVVHDEYAGAPGVIERRWHVRA